jgi:hypothetical protein
MADDDILVLRRTDGFPLARHTQPTQPRYEREEKRKCYHYEPTGYCANHSAHANDLFEYDFLRLDIFQRQLEIHNVKSVYVCSCNLSTCCDWEGICKLKFINYEGDSLFVADANDAQFRISKKNLVLYDRIDVNM